MKDKELQQSREALRGVVAGVDLREYANSNLPLNIPEEEIDMERHIALNYMRGILETLIRVYTGEEKVNPGSFLEHIISNDLMGATESASQLHYIGLKVYMKFIYEFVEPELAVAMKEKIEGQKQYRRCF